MNALRSSSWDWGGAWDQYSVQNVFHHRLLGSHDLPLTMFTDPQQRQMSGLFQIIVSSS
jgi:hypothetical protein